VTRNRASAKAAGTRFERSVADYLAAELDDRIDRRVKTGAKDRGDIAGLRINGHRIVVECKDRTRQDLAGTIAEAHTQADNDGALIGIAVTKRVGVADPARQWVHMTLADLVALLQAATEGTP
jgi:hypothetical protein